LHIKIWCFLDETLKQVYEQKLKRLASEWEEFIGRYIYEEEKLKGDVFNSVFTSVYQPLT